jgi:23S rRNA (guanine745-N1)-methyltransferase
MNVIKTNNLACPIDGAQLELHEQQLSCENGHGFDIARNGYVNLLPVQHKRTKQPGDSKEMVTARTQFLNSGIYEPVANKLVEIGLSLIKDMPVIQGEETCLMDAGCGEGYYFNFFFNCLKDKASEAENLHDISFIGLDISKPAIAEAAKGNKQISWIVGTNRQPPVKEASVDIVICVFGFQSFEGFNKILKHGGKIIIVEPGPDHLRELREIIYKDIKKTSSNELSHTEKNGFTLVDYDHLQFKTGPVNNDQINNLLIMTPHLYRATKEGKEAAANLQQLDLTVDIVYKILEKL